MQPDIWYLPSLLEIFAQIQLEKLRITFGGEFSKVRGNHSRIARRYIYIVNYRGRFYLR